LNDFTLANQESLDELAWAMEACQGQFCLMLARCNYGYLQQRLIQQLQDECTFGIRLIHLKPDDKTLFSTVRSQLGQEIPSALMVSGFAALDNVDDMFAAMNQVREEFRKNFPFPFILWMNDRVYIRLLRIAPDFESWATTTAFAIPTDELINSLQQAVKSLFAKALAVNSPQSLYKLANILDLGCLTRSEFEVALKELSQRELDLTPQFEADLAFLRGLNAGDSPEALDYFQKSLEFWQQQTDVGAGFTDNPSPQTDNLTKPAPFPTIDADFTDNPSPQTDNLNQPTLIEEPGETINPQLKVGLVLFHIGLYHYYAVDRTKHREVNWQPAKIALQQCLEIFKQENRPDLVAKSITQLERVLQRMQSWDELEEIAQKAVSLHQRYGITNKLAQDYSFLAEVALQKQRWEESRQAAQQAEDILAQLLEQKRWVQGLNLLFLAQAERQLGNKHDAIAHLVQARDLGDRGHPLVYIRILAELRDLYFEEKHYLDAFATKQLRRSIEQQYSICAFIGAGRLQPHRQEASAKTDNQETVAPEIIASGRQRDLERLLERIGRNDCKLIVIHGLSGVGKSSLVNAGLRPALKHRVIGIQNNLPLLIRVYTNWVEELNKQLATDFVRDELEEEKTANNPVGAGLDDNISIKPPTFQQNPPDSSVGSGLGDNLSRKPQTSQQNPPSPSQDVDNNLSRKPPISPQNPPYAKILEQLRQNEQHNIRTVLIFDQFEEFFFVYPNLAQRRPFWDFLGDCLNVLSVKVILSLREDYLHYLLECNRLDSMSVIGHDILGKNVLYGLGNFSPADARSIIEDLTTRSRFYLEPALIDQLVKDLAGQTGEILPIELQIVGAQLQAENIKILADYREVGTKDELVKHYVEAVIEDCGVENRQAAELVLYLLTDEKGTRPLKTRAELERDLKEFVDDLTTDASKLDLVLRIFVESGLVFLLPELPAARYQLVHDYLAVFIRQQQQLGLLVELAEVREKQKLTEAQLRQALKEKEAALHKEQEERQRAKLAEYEALNSLSQLLWSSHDQLGTLLALVKAGKKLQEIADLVLSEKQALTLSRLYQTIQQMQEYNRLEGHNGLVYSVNFSPDGQMIVSASLDGTVKLWRVGGTLVQTFPAHPSGVKSVIFSPNGQMIASAGSNDPSIKLWKTDGTLKQKFSGHQKGVQTISFSPDGQMIVSGGGDGTLKLWKIDGTLEQTFQGHSNVVTSVSFSPDGRMIASASLDKTVKLWSINGSLVGTCPNNSEPSTRLESTNSTENSYRRLVFSVSFSPDGQMIASAENSGTVKIWSLDGSLIKKCRGHKNSVRSTSFSPDGQMIASASEDGTVKLWNLNAMELQTFQGDSSELYSVSFSPDEQMIASADNHAVKMWRISRNTLVKTFQEHTGRVTSVSFSPDGQIIASASEDGTVKLINLSDTLVQTYPTHSSGVTNVSFSPDGQIIASASEDSTMKLWRIDGTLLHTMEGHRSGVNSVSFSPDGQMITSASRDYTMKLWRIDGTLLHTMKGHRSGVNSVSFSPDGQMIASASGDNTVKLWRIDGFLERTFHGHNSSVFCVSFSPDGQLIASASYDCTVKLWRLDGSLERTFTRQNESVYSVSFSPDGQMIISASFDGTVKLWRIDGTLIQTFQGHSGGVASASFSPDGEMIASASHDHTVKLWKLESLDNLIVRGCNWLRDYLKTNPNVSESDRKLCEGIEKSGK
jgi:WD40 repeat protein